LKRIRALNTPYCRRAARGRLTAYAWPSDRDRALAAGFVDYVIRPVDPEEFVSVLTSILETRG
jgi:CheY-like chemotaxis protein